MSYILNPYAQGGQWTEINYWPNPHAPTYGALVSHPAVASPTMVELQFNTGRRVDPLNSTVAFSGARDALMTITTRVENGTKITTFASASDGTTFGTLEWIDGQPYISIRNRVERQHAGQWLNVSRDKCTASMAVGTDFFLWVFKNGCIKIYRDPTQSERLGKLYWNPTAKCLCMEIHNSLLQTAGNLEALVVAAALLQSHE
ncbi:hypothetical protein DFP72DRAFT_1046276 [Ephemerocybe angulata]|uniref:Uncharacterized protein n=1 Tax=Ephemerocybe angulata TaxID=980116 RepID=A0A8H6HXB6_9AGAR|nr:hypothetical protein DFP72DRAFT_1046276 [Tulosesus angulatus]